MTKFAQVPPFLKNQNTIKFTNNLKLFHLCKLNEITLKNEISLNKKRIFLLEFYLVRCLSLDPISCHHSLQSHGFCYKNNLYYEICCCSLKSLSQYLGNLQEIKKNSELFVAKTKFGLKKLQRINAQVEFSSCKT